METISTISTTERLIMAAADDEVNKKGEIISTLVADEGSTTLAVVDIVTYRSGNNLIRAAVDKSKNVETISTWLLPREKNLSAVDEVKGKK